MLILPWDAADDPGWREWLTSTGALPMHLAGILPVVLAGAAAQRAGRGRPPSAERTRAHSKLDLIG